MDDALSTARSTGSRYGSPRSPRSPRKPLGWVTVAKEGRDLVSLAASLPSGERQQHIRAWSRRIAVDRSVGGGKPGGASSSAVDVKKNKRGDGKKNKSNVNAKDQQSKFQNELAVRLHQPRRRPRNGR